MRAFVERALVLAVLVAFGHIQHTFQNPRLTVKVAYPITYTIAID